MKEAIIDETTIDVTGKDQGSNLEDGIEPEAGSGEDVPFDKNPRWIKMSEKGQAIDNILESHGFDSMEELQESLTDSTLLRSL